MLLRFVVAAWLNLRLRKNKCYNTFVSGSKVFSVFVCGTIHHRTVNIRCMLIDLISPFCEKKYAHKILRIIFSLIPHFCDDLLFNIFATYYLFEKTTLYKQTKRKTDRVVWKKKYTHTNEFFSIKNYFHS